MVYTRVMKNNPPNEYQRARERMHIMWEQMQQTGVVHIQLAGNMCARYVSTHTARLLRVPHVLRQVSHW